jgi:hypothetical protein
VFTVEGVEELPAGSGESKYQDTGQITFVGSRGEFVVLTVSFGCVTRRMCWAGHVD